MHTLHISYTLEECLRGSTNQPYIAPSNVPSAIGTLALDNHPLEHSKLLCIRRTPQGRMSRFKHPSTKFGIIKLAFFVRGNRNVKRDLRGSVQKILKIHPKASFPIEECQESIRSWLLQIQLPMPTQFCLPMQSASPSNWESSK